MRRPFQLLSLLALSVPLTLSSRAAFADLELPRPSPFAKVSQDVGLTTITVDYSSPAVKGRKIWGALVPFDKMWRTGANVATKITFSKDVTLADQAVPAGTYALFTIPGAKEWTVILNKNPDQPGTQQNYKQELDLLRVKVKPKATTAIRERLAFIFNDFTDDAASLDLEWEKLRVSLPIKVGTAAQAVANINKEVDNVWRVFNSAARYTLETKKDPDTALKYVDQSLALKEEWFNLWTKASILAAKKNFKEATTLAQKSYDLGAKQGPGFFLEPEVKKAIAEWSKK